MESNTNGVLNNHPNRIESTSNRGLTTFSVYDSKYTDDEAVGSSIPNNILFDKTFNKQDIEGYYAIRVFYDTTPVQDVYTPVLIMDIYEDGVLKEWTTGDQINGEIVLDYFDQTITLGSRVTLWFNPSIEYRIVLRTHPSLSNCTVNLDYLQFTQIHHANPLMSWVNASEITGGDLWMFDAGNDVITGTGAVYAQSTIYPNYPFKQIIYVDVSAESTTGKYNATPYNVGTSSFNYAVRDVDGANWSTGVNIRWKCMGLLELPAIRPL